MMISIQGSKTMKREVVARKLVRLAQSLMAMEFDTEEALKKYLKEHPDADKSNHRVKKQTKKKKEAPAQKSQSKAKYNVSPVSPEHIVITDVDTSNTEAVNKALMGLYKHLANHKDSLSKHFDLSGLLTQQPKKTKSTIVVKTGFKGGDFSDADKVLKPILQKMRGKKSRLDREIWEARKMLEAMEFETEEEMRWSDA